MVLLPLHESFGSLLLSRTLLYTALTRARGLAVLVGTRAALRRCVAHDGASRRMGVLRARLVAAAVKAGVEPVAPEVFGD